MIHLLQTPIVPIPPVDSLNLEEKATQIVQTIKTTPAEVLLQQLGEQIIQFGLKLLAAIAIYAVGIWLTRRIKKLVGKIFIRIGTDPAIVSFTQTALTISLTLIVIIVAIGTLGINTSSLAALLAAGGVAIGMALSGTAQNFAGGIMILAIKPFKVGDYIQAQNYEGVVTNISIVNTKLTTYDRKVIVIPNGILSNGTIENFTSSDIRRVEWLVEIDYGNSTEKAREVLLSIARSHPKHLTVETGAPANPVVILKALNDYTIQMSMRCWVKVEDYWNLLYDVNEEIYNILPANGVTFTYPRLDVTTLNK